MGMINYFNAMKAGELVLVLVIVLGLVVYRAIVYLVRLGVKMLEIVDKLMAEKAVKKKGKTKESLLSWV